MSSRSRKPELERAAPLREFLQAELQRRDISLRTAAKGMGISHSHLSNIMTGHRTPDAGVCNAMAGYLGKRKIEIYYLAGWLGEEDLKDTSHALR